MSFAERLKKLGFVSYAEYLRSCSWVAFRKTRIERMPEDAACRVCQSKRFHFHHTTYERLGHEDFLDVIPLCGPRHHEVHKWLDEHKKSVQFTHEAVSYLAAVFRPEDRRPERMEKPGRRKKKRRKRNGNGGLFYPGKVTGRASTPEHLKKKSEADAALKEHRKALTQSEQYRIISEVGHGPNGKRVKPSAPSGVRVANGRTDGVKSGQPPQTGPSPEK